LTGIRIFCCCKRGAGKSEKIIQASSKGKVGVAAEGRNLPGNKLAGSIQGIQDLTEMPMALVNKLGN